MDKFLRYRAPTLRSLTLPSPRARPTACARPSRLTAAQCGRYAAANLVRASRRVPTDTERQLKEKHPAKAQTPTKHQNARPTGANPLMLRGRCPLPPRSARWLLHVRHVAGVRITSLTAPHAGALSAPVSVKGLSRHKPLPTVAIYSTTP